MPKKAKSPKDKKLSEVPVMDVSKPGKIPPTQAGGRPVIVKQRSIVQDPMVQGGADDKTIAVEPVDTKEQHIKETLSVKPISKRLVLTPSTQHDLKSEAKAPEPGQTITADKPVDTEKPAEAVDFKDLKLDNKTTEEKPVEPVGSKPTDDQKPNETTEKADAPKPKEAGVTATQNSALPTNTPIDPEDLGDLVSDEPLVENSEKDSETKDTNKKVIEPSEEAKAAAEAAKDEPKEDEDENNTDAKKDESDSEESSGDVSEEEQVEGAIVQEPEGGLVDELAKQAVAKKQAAEQSKEDTVQQEKLRGLINDKTYFVPISQITRHRRKVVTVLILLLLLGAVGLNLAMDAGMVDLGVQPLTDIIKER